MGLGKTAEVHQSIFWAQEIKSKWLIIEIRQAIALMVTNPREDFPASENGIIPSAATLVLCPVTLVTQVKYCVRWALQSAKSHYFRSGSRKLKNLHQRWKFSFIMARTVI
jgi:hypothetical protein